MPRRSGSAQPFYAPYSTDRDSIAFTDWGRKIYYETRVCLVYREQLAISERFDTDKAQELIARYSRKRLAHGQLYMMDDSITFDKLKFTKAQSLRSTLKYREIVGLYVGLVKPEYFVLGVHSLQDGDRQYQVFKCKTAQNVLEVENQIRRARSNPRFRLSTMTLTSSRPCSAARYSTQQSVSYSGGGFEPRYKSLEMGTPEDVVVRSEGLGQVQSYSRMGVRHRSHPRLEARKQSIMALQARAIPTPDPSPLPPQQETEVVSSVQPAVSAKVPVEAIDHVQQSKVKHDDQLASEGLRLSYSWRHGWTIDPKGSVYLWSSCYSEPIHRQSLVSSLGDSGCNVMQELDAALEEADKTPEPISSNHSEQEDRNESSEIIRPASPRFVRQPMVSEV